MSDLVDEIYNHNVNKKYFHHFRFVFKIEIIYLHRVLHINLRFANCKLSKIYI